ncbi:jg19450 [Pararge aegeria aegeria]|uniref:Jg19450 protein n=1 Tax=Pararge aegeria aegeria TaxID=348720 RepID=A0A8S4S4V7_9NEOP|nr:jg19450 [Pararge aegeria aegeria]
MLIGTFSTISCGTDDEEDGKGWLAIYARHKEADGGMLGEFLNDSMAVPALRVVKLKWQWAGTQFREPMDVGVPDVKNPVDGRGPRTMWQTSSSESLEMTLPPPKPNIPGLDFGIP